MTGRIGYFGRLVEIALVICLIGLKNIPDLDAADFSKLSRMIGKRDAALVADSSGRVLFSRHADRLLIPASTLKVFTALYALHNLGPDYRFATEFYLDAKADLRIKGYGDPLLISEVVSDICRLLATKLERIENLVLDESFFAHPLTIPGVTSSYQPYDAPNGALCVNFNTVNFIRRNGRYVSAEPQTPLLPYLLPRIHRSGLARGRILLSAARSDNTLYAGHLFRFFLEQQGLKVDGRIKLATGAKETGQGRLIYRHVSPFTLEQVIARCLEYSNNFMANQVFLAAGIDAFGAPGTLANSVRSAKAFAADTLNLPGFKLVEGSGISRENRISAEGLLTVLNHFEPYHRLMRREDRIFYKSGTLKGIRTRIGYILNPKGELMRFVVLLNTSGSSAVKVVEGIREGLDL